MGAEEDRQARMRRTWRRARGEEQPVTLTKVELAAAFTALDGIKPQLINQVGGVIDGAVPGLTLLERGHIFAAWLAEELS